MLTLLGITSTGLELTGKWVLLLAAVAGAVGVLCRMLWKALRWLWRFVQLSIRAFEDIVGTPEQPSLRQAMQEVREIAERSEKELHPNGGSSLRDDVRQSSEVASRAAERAEEAVLLQQASTAESRLTSERMQHDITNIRHGTQGLVEIVEDLRDRVDLNDSKRARQTQAIGDALIESVDAAIAAEEPRP